MKQSKIPHMKFAITSTKNIVLACCTLNAIFLGRCAVLPLLKPYADSFDNNLGNFEQTLLFGIFYISMGASSFGLQKLADLFTCRTIIIVSSFGMSAAFVFQALSRKFWVLVLARFSTGLFAGLQPVIVTYFRHSASFDVYPEKAEEKYNSTLGLWVGIAFCLGPLSNIAFVAIGKAIFKTELGGYLTAFFIASGLNLLVGILCLVLLAPDKINPHPQKEREPNSKHGYRDRSIIWLIVTAVFCIEIGYSAVFSLLPQYHDPIKARGGFNLESTSIAIMFSMFGFGLALGSPIGENLNWTSMEKILAGMIALVAGVFLVPFMTFYNGNSIILKTTLAAIPCFISGIGMGVCYIYIFVEMLSRFEGTQAKFFSSLIITVTCVGNLSATVLGILADATSVVFSLWICGGILVFGTILITIAICMAQKDSQIAVWKLESSL